MNNRCQLKQSQILGRSMFVAFFLCLTGQDVLAQAIGSVEETNSNVDSYYYFVQPGAPKIRAYVMGAARNAGIYELTEGTSMKELLALAGGPKLESHRSVRRQKTLVRYYPSGVSKKDAPAYEGELNEALLNSSELPELVDGSVLTLEVVELRGFEWRDVLSVLSTAVLVVLAVHQLSTK